MGVRRESEASFTRAVLAYAHLHGWRCAHFRPARTERGWRTAVSGDGVGFPDLIMVHPGRGRVVAAELKVGANKPTPSQRDWLSAFGAAGVSAYLWTPADWASIESVLSGGA